MYVGIKDTVRTKHVGLQSNELYSILINIKYVHYQYTYVYIIFKLLNIIIYILLHIN